MKGSSLISNLVVTNQTVENKLNVNMFNQPQIYNGAFSAGSLIPLVFGSYSFAEIKLNMKSTAIDNTYISAKDTTNVGFSNAEANEIITKTTAINSTTPSY
jgi:hypothetical protein